MPAGFERAPLTQDEADRLASACESHRERLVVWTLLDTGLRLSELLSLDRSSIDWQAHRLRVVGKGDKRRVVPLTPRAWALLEHHFALHESIDASPRTLQRLVKRVANRAEISRPVTPHVLRHTFAVTALQRGLSLAALQKLLGHERLETTALYLRISNEEALREFREKW